MKILVSVLFASGLCLPLHAHDPGLSSARVQVTPDAVRVEVTIDDLDAVAMGGRAKLLVLGRDGFRLATGDRTLAPDRVDLRWDVDGNAVLDLTFEPSAVPMQLEAPAFDMLPRGHRMYAWLSGSDGRLVADSLLHAQRRVFPLDAADVIRQDATATGLRFLALGFEHILIGYDHLLFLLTLLLTTRRLREAALVITSFTAAHSVTLVAAALDFIRLPGALVEACIAASIVYVALENLLRKKPRSRWRVTFAFGLVHGFGFASVLRELGLEQGDLVVPLLSFNLGIEIGQLAMAALSLPAIALLARHPALRRAIPALSLAAAGVGVWWLLERAV